MESLLKNNQCQACIDLCDRTLSCYHDNNDTLDTSSFLSQGSVLFGQDDDDSGRLSQRFSTNAENVSATKTSGDHSRENVLYSETNSKSGNFVSSQQISNKPHVVGSKISKSAREKRKLETEELPDDEMSFRAVDAVSLMFKGKALIKLGQNMEALSCLQR